MVKRITFILILILSFKLAPAHALWGLFESHEDKAEIEIVLRQVPKTPIRIQKVKLRDYGVNDLAEKEVAHSFLFKVKNFSKKNILSYKILVKEYHPFQEVENVEFSVSSVKKLKPKKNHKIYEQRTINENIDTLYIVSVDEVLFEDGTLWDAKQGIMKP